MVRKKVYKKQHILAAAQELLTEKGFSYITARNVAEHMGISTQPIYLEFENMEELKLTLLHSIYDYLETEFFCQTQTANHFVNVGLNYIDLAKSNNKLYLSLYTDQHSYGQELRQLSFDSFQKKLQKSEKYQALSIDQLETLYLDLWVVATGIASLTISGILTQTKEQLITIFEKIEQKAFAV